MSSQIAGWFRLLEDSEAYHWLVIVVVAAGIYGVMLAMFIILLRYFDPLRQQIESLSAPEITPPLASAWFFDKLDRFSGFFVPRNQGLRNRTIDRLTHAGFRSPNRLLVYYFVRVMLMASLPVLVLLGAPLFPKLSLQQVMAFAFSAFSVGMIAPSYFLDKRVARQQAFLRKALPDAIDLLVVCTEAGLGLNAALVRTALALVDFHPALAEELLLVNSEIRAGVDRNQALLNLAQRTGLDDIKSLVAVLGNSLRFGASVAHTLRIYSEEFRDKRMQKADEEAAKLSTKMIFPLAFCFMPGFFIVALGPTIVHIFALWPTLGR